MKCPYCKCEETNVKDTRSSTDGFVIKRRRICPNCNAKFNTVERLVKKEIYVIKNNNERELFDIEKVKNSLNYCAGKRLEQSKIDQLVETIAERVNNCGVNEIKSSVIGDMIMDLLERIDKVSLIRFASVYMKFDTPEDFKRFIKRIGG